METRKESTGNEQVGESVTQFDLRDVNMRLFQHWFNAQLFENAFCIDDDPPYVLQGRSMVSEYTCHYLLSRGDSNDDAISLMVMQFKTNELYINLTESYGIMRAWIDRMFAPPAIGNDSNHQDTRKAQAKHKLNLTPRQGEAAELFAAGKTAAMIASELVIAEGTVNNHLNEVRRELKVHMGMCREFSNGEARTLLISLGYGSD